MKKTILGTIHADHLTLNEAIDAIEELVSAGRGGFVVTPNIDHVVLAERNSSLQDAYAHAALSLVDGMLLKWMSNILGHSLPEKVSGSDLVKPLLRRAASKQMRVYFLGGEPGVGEKAAERLQKEMGALNIVGIDSPPFGFEKTPVLEQETMTKVIEAKPELALFALGCPKQELLMYRWYERLAPCVLLGIGASLDFIAGHVQRSPEWLSNIGLEWAYRLSQDPKRLAKRYLVRDLAILPIILRMLRTSKHERVFYSE
ncbi:MAG: WecB/TagA/CpsF family glycosyltransferase [Proteobacteria bacterium]|nr:WecB/TagA/CpsF family glycosyltransferase [Pseudomonadota bacterium]